MNMFLDCKAAMARVRSCFSSFNCSCKCFTSNFNAFNSFCSLITIVHKLGDPLPEVECMGNDGDLTNASIDRLSSSHSEKKSLFINY